MFILSRKLFDLSSFLYLSVVKKGFCGCRQIHCFVYTKLSISRFEWRVFNFQ